MDSHFNLIYDVLPKAKITKEKIKIVAPQPIAQAVAPLPKATEEVKDIPSKFL